MSKTRMRRMVSTVTSEAGFTTTSTHARSAPPDEDPDMRAGWLAYGMAAGREVRESRRRGRFSVDD